MADRRDRRQSGKNIDYFSLNISHCVTFSNRLSGTDPHLARLGDSVEKSVNPHIVGYSLPNELRVANRAPEWKLAMKAACRCANVAPHYFPA